VDAILLFTDVKCRINARQAGASYANTDGIGVKTLERKNLKTLKMLETWGKENKTFNTR